jgi:3-oxoacyl-[acyl-carrier protein] reductase
MITYDFKNKIALVSGSSSGIGEQIARDLCKWGAIVVLNSTKGDILLEKTYKDFVKQGFNCTYEYADVSNETQVAEMFKNIEAKFGRLDFLVNNAGIALNVSIENTTMERWDKVMEVNLMGKMLCTKYAIPLLKKSVTPRIVNIASRLGTMPLKDSCAYCCSEAGIMMLTKCSALEFADYNIKVNTVSPGPTITQLNLKKYSREELSHMAEVNPSKRLGDVKDTSNAVCFLLADEAEYINGESLEVSGGILLVTK